MFLTINTGHGDLNQRQQWGYESTIQIEPKGIYCITNRDFQRGLDSLIMEVRKGIG